MVSQKDKAQCSGCAACEAVCGHRAIRMQPDTLGFLYPEINKTLCVDCGLCDKVCAFNEMYDVSSNLEEPTFFGARQKDIREVDKSRSGAIFAALCDEILSKQGTVYGASFDKAFKVSHKRALTKKECDEFRGSKYVQSDMRGIIPQVERDLRDGYHVLFSGTPCQVAGIKSYLQLKHINTANLLLCDIICHGVPAPYLWRDYLEFVKKRHNGEIKTVEFRDKRFGWAAHKESFVIGDKDKYVAADTFTYAFYKHIMFRHSCGICHYANLKRTGDITLGDFWGFQKTDSNLNKDDRGISLILVNTSKGTDYFNRISNRIISIPAVKDLCLQPNLIHPSDIDSYRDRFEESYARYGFEKTMSRFALMGWRYDWERTKRRMRHKLRRLFKN